MSQTSDRVSRVLARVSVLAIVVAVMIVPAAARSHERMEHHDATRLSIKHSWLGVAPPSKISVAHQQIVVRPAVALEPEPSRVAPPAVPVDVPVHPVLDFSPDLLRGPPALRLA